MKYCHWVAEQRIVENGRLAWSIGTTQHAWGKYY